MQICLNASDAKDIAVLTGEAPRDSSCKPSNVRKTAGGGVDFDLDCSENGKFSASTKLSAGGSALITQKVPVSNNAPGTKVTYVHGKRLQSCTK